MPMMAVVVMMVMAVIVATVVVMAVAVVVAGCHRLVLSLRRTNQCYGGQHPQNS